MAVDGYSLVLESITPAPPARLTFGQSIVVRLRYASLTNDVRISVQPSTNSGCGGYQNQFSSDIATLVRAGAGTLERTYTISTANVVGCGQTEIRLENGEIYAPLIRLLMARPLPDPSGSLLFFEQYLTAEYRFGP
jgi:hypothetical protein